MKAFSGKSLMMVGAAVFIVAACNPAPEPTVTLAPTEPPPPAPTSTLVPSPTPIPPTPTPITRVEVDDAPEDGFHCETGELGAASTPLPAVVDVTRAWVEFDEESQAYLFSVEFGRAETLAQRFVGGLHVYDVEIGLLEPFSQEWYFDNTTNWTLNFGFTPPDTINVSLKLIRDGVWDAGETEALASINGNVFTISVPIEEVTSTGTWGWGLTNAAYAVCERVGYDDSDRPMLPLPPRP